MKVQTFGRLFKLEAKKMVGAKGAWLFIAMFVSLIASLSLRWIGLAIHEDITASYNVHSFEVLVTIGFYLLGYVVAPLLVFKNLFFDDLKQKVIQLYVGAGYSRRQLFMAKTVVAVLSTLVVCLLVMTHQMLEGVLDYNICTPQHHFCRVQESLNYPMLIALINFGLLFFVEITIIYLALGSFLIKLNGINVILHIVYSCILSIFVATIFSVLMMGLFKDNFDGYMNTVPIFFFVTNAISLLYLYTMFNASFVVEQAFVSDPNRFYAGFCYNFGLGCACIVILCIYYVVKAWIMFNRKDF